MILVGENADAYDKIMKAKSERGKMELDWRALVESAVRS